MNKKMGRAGLFVTSCPLPPSEAMRCMLKFVPDKFVERAGFHPAQHCAAKDVFY
ncbi:MAG: hypothetical protein ACI9C4_002935 [Paraglaciecola sp.]|jgi:hypothetical protein